MSALSYIYALKQYGESFYFTIKYLNNHAFLIVGAPRKEDRAPLLKDDVICDTWAGSVFPAAFARQKLTDFSGLEPSQPKLCQRLPHTIVKEWVDSFVYSDAKQIPQQLPPQSDAIVEEFSF